jgi:hypothetical protein
MTELLANAARTANRCGAGRMPTAQTVPDPDDSFCCLCGGTQFTRLHILSRADFSNESFSSDKAIIKWRMLRAASPIEPAGTPIELATAFLNEFRGFRAKLSQSVTILICDGK